ARQCSCGRPGSAAGLNSGRLHDVPRGDLADPTQLGREGVPQRHLLQRGGQGRSLRRLGGTGALLGRVARRLPPAALADTRELGVTYTRGRIDEYLGGRLGRGGGGWATVETR